MGWTAPGAGAATAPGAGAGWIAPGGAPAGRAAPGPARRRDRAGRRLRPRLALAELGDHEADADQHDQAAERDAADQQDPAQDPAATLGGAPHALRLDAVLAVAALVLAAPGRRQPRRRRAQRPVDQRRRHGQAPGHRVAGHEQGQHVLASDLLEQLLERVREAGVADLLRHPPEHALRPLAELAEGQHRAAPEHRAVGDGVDAHALAIGLLADPGHPVAVVGGVAAVGHDDQDPAQRLGRGALGRRRRLLEQAQAALDRGQQHRRVGGLGELDLVELIAGLLGRGQSGGGDVLAVAEDRDLRRARQVVEQLLVDRLLDRRQVAGDVELDRRLVLGQVGGVGVGGLDDEDDRGLGVGAVEGAGQVRDVLEAGALEGPGLLAGDVEDAAGGLEVDRVDEDAQPGQPVQHRRRDLDPVDRDPLEAERVVVAGVGGAARGQADGERDRDDRDRGWVPGTGHAVDKVARSGRP
ncbi:MAG: hypothetical protein H6708_20300 [Kofleriaceae bacterium]|nr:hypothetical protein [Kofleriaceae bacterium]